MFENKAQDGRNNICGKKIFVLRKKHIPKMSQRIFAQQLQIRGIDANKNAIQRIESENKFVTDIELKTLAEIFNVSCDELLN